ncbi:MAG: HD domain-containing protein [Candidatus Kapaibacterium sp.]
MILNFSLVNELFRGFHILRWNDRVRPMDMIEIDKHAHKMVIAYCLGKYEEMNGNKVDWDKIIKGGIYELLRRIVISDIKSPIYTEIMKNKQVFSKLNEFVYKSLEPKIENEELKSELKTFLIEDHEEDLNIRILDAAHIYASLWEFRIIKQANPIDYQNDRIYTSLIKRVNKYEGLSGIKKMQDQEKIVNFIDMVGQLRFQFRWAQIPRVPKTSVLGHTMLVACISYFFARENGACPQRLFNNFFGGLFHDLPEAVTRDIISPVKRSSSELDKLIKDLEESLSEQEIYPYIEPEWKNELNYFTKDEFVNKIFHNGHIFKQMKGRDITVDDINAKYNTDEYSAFDGELIKAADHLAAFLEAWNSCNSGIKTEELSRAAHDIKSKYRNQVIGKVQIKSLYSYFTHPC